jgi:hypothetical protein
MCSYRYLFEQPPLALLMLKVYEETKEHVIALLYAELIGYLLWNGSRCPVLSNIPFHAPREGATLTYLDILKNYKNAKEQKAYGMVGNLLTQIRVEVGTTKSYLRIDGEDIYTTKCSVIVHRLFKKKEGETLTEFVRRALGKKLKAQILDWLHNINFPSFTQNYGAINDYSWV